MQNQSDVPGFQKYVFLKGGTSMADFNEFNNYDNSGSYSGSSYNRNEFDQNSFANYDLGAGAQSTYYREGAAAPTVSLNTYIARTFLWMFAGLLVTFVVSLGLVFSGGVYTLLIGVGRVAIIVALIAQLILVGILSVRVRSLSVGAARALFLAYAALNGLSFSIYFVAFDVPILIMAFGATALMFGGIAAASLIFNLQLDTLRPILFGGLIVMILFGILSYFMNFGVINTLLCYAGIALFMGYTAYDTSKIKDNYNYYATIGDSTMLEKASVFSALQLYLDFVNMMLYIIRLFANSKGSKRN
jgi:FtsH-binding integral membrane protein